MEIARLNNLKRIMRCCTIMGRSEDEENLSAAQIMYPCMQCSDIFFLKADICQLGMDQRKVNVLAREYCDDIKVKQKPVILSHPMVMGLKENQEKQSKSDPDSVIFMQDSAEDVEKKINKAFCPATVENNPVLNMIKLIVFEKYSQITVKRTVENGGDVVYNSYRQLEDDYVNKKLHPGDLKSTTAKYLNEMIQTVRDHFEKNPYAKELLAKVRSYNITR